MISRGFTDQDSGFEDTERMDLQISQINGQPADFNSQSIIDQNQIYHLQLQQYHAWMYYQQQQSESSYNLQQTVFKIEVSSRKNFTIKYLI